MERNGKKAVRVCLLPNALKIDSKQFSLFEKVRQAQATAEEMDQYKRFQQRRTRDILEARPESLFKIEDVSFGIPSKAVIMASELCDVCGESTQVDLLHEIHGQKVCRTCAQQRGWEWLPQ